MGFQIKTSRNSSYTQIPDSFIRTYMPEANGNFVKVYLYLLMASQHPSDTGDLSVSSLADSMECTENDILRALRYWQKSNLLMLTERDGAILSVTLCDLDQPEKTEDILPPESISPAEDFSPAEDLPPVKGLPPAEDLPPAEAKPVGILLPDRHTYTPLQAEALQKDVAIDRTISQVEELLGTPVSPSHLQLILYFMCDIGFSSELLVTLYQTAVKKGKKQPKYIEAIGISWAKQGIRTPEEAIAESSHFNGRYAIVARAFGIQGNLRPAEQQYVDRWSSYQFPDSIIEEACRRTILQTGDANWKYASSILKDWHEKHVLSLSDVEKCDKSHKRQQSQKKNTVAAKTPQRKNSFQSFPQRAYSAKEFDNLEKQLLRGQKMKA